MTIETVDIVLFFAFGAALMLLLGYTCYMDNKYGRTWPVKGGR